MSKKSLLIFVLFMAALAFSFWQGIYLPKDRNFQENKLFIINKGEGLEGIAVDLKNQGFIKSKLLFEVYVAFLGQAEKLKAGKYEISPSLSAAQIIKKFVRGEGVPLGVKVTIPEGFTLKQIDSRLAGLGLIEPGQIDSQSQLEGYLFPDTYWFNEGIEAKEIISKMRDNFDRKINKQIKEEIFKQEKTLEEIIIMASLIEKEVASNEDRRIVSGIFWKRLAENRPLQSCATIAYILGKDKWRYSLEDTKIESPYNTYQNVGLPPGPICNPGLSAIKAAIEPKESGYNYFLSTPEGETIFSRTLKEHNIAKQKYLK